MRGFLAVSIGVTLTLSPLTPATATAAATATTARPEPTPQEEGGTQSLPLTPLTRALDADQGVSRHDVTPFSLLGVVWNDPTAELHGRVQTRTRATATGDWSDWQDLDVHNDDHGADPDTQEYDESARRGGTAPLWVGDADGVEVRVSPEREPDDRTRTLGAQSLPAGLRLELVNPGVEEPETAAQDEAEPTSRAAKPRTATRPKIVSRKGWGADESLREKKFGYTKDLKAAFVHHTATGNRYTCAQAPSVIRGIYRYHVKSMGWKDIGYNFLVDKCGTIYEGRAGGVTRPVLGAHTMGFNAHSVGIAVIGTYGSTRPSNSATTSVARLIAWKLGLYGVDPRGRTYLKSAGGNLYRKGKNVRLNVISGHRDGFATDCPGKQLYGRLGSIRTTAAHYQGR